MQLGTRQRSSGLRADGATADGHTAVMAYDETLADRIREHLSGQDGLTERKMFGGIGFMIHGHMAVAANSKGGIMVRVDPQGEGHPLLRPMEMRGRTMGGWLTNDPEHDLDDDDLAELVDMGRTYVLTLPPKAGR